MTERYPKRTVCHDGMVTRYRCTLHLACRVCGHVDSHIPICNAPEWCACQEPA